MNDTATAEQDQWQQAAQSQQGGAPQQGQPNIPTPAQSTLSAAQNPDRSAIDPTSMTSDKSIGGAVPVVLRPARGGLLGIVDKMADVLTGTTKPETYKDPDGNEYVYHPEMSHGQQWARIGAAALAGAAKGVAAGPNKGAAAGAGFDAGQKIAQQQQQNEQDMDEEARKTNLANANNQILRMNLAKESWNAARLKVEATQHDVQFSQQQEDRLTKEGARFLGTAAHPGDIGEILKVQPDVMKQMVQNHTVEILPHYNEDGSPSGVRVFMMPQDYRTQLAPKGTKFPVFNQVTHDYDWHETADATTQGDIDDYWTAAGVAKQKFMNDAKEQELKQSEIEEHKQNTASKRAETPSLIARNNAEAAKAHSESVPNQSTPEVQNDIAEGLASGRYLMGKDVPVRTTKDQASAAQYAKAADDYSRQHFGLPYSPEIIRQEAHFAQQQHVQAYLSSIDRMIGTPGISGQLDQVLDLAKRAGVVEKGGNISTPWSTVKQYVRQRLGDESAKNLEQGLSDTQTALGTLIGNPLLGSGESDLKLKTAQSQYGKDMTLANLELANKTVKDILGRAREQLARNNRYIQQRYGDAYSPQGQQQVTVKLSNGKTGTIPAQNLTKFLQDNPGSARVQ